MCIGRAFMQGTVLKAVFDVRPTSKFSDDISRRYDFRSRRNNTDVAHAATGDWVLFREVGGGRKLPAYIAVARVIAVEDSGLAVGFSNAIITDYLPFPTRVPMKLDGEYAEAELRKVPRPVQIGQVFQTYPMRDIPDGDFDNITRAGFDLEPGTEALGERSANRELDEGGDDALAPSGDRRIESLFVKRAFRDDAFRKHVGSHYDHRCALTGLTLPDGLGRYEGEAAHLHGVAAGGPDVIHNGIYVFRTGHWLLDAHVISIDRDYTLLTVPGLLPAALTGLLVASGHQILLPRNERVWPQAKFLDVHRAAFWKKRGS